MKEEDTDDSNIYFKDGHLLTVEDIIQIPAINDNPISSILINLYTKNNKFEIQDLLNDLRLFVTQTPLETKLRFLFKIYDMDCDGYITHSELFSIVELLCEEKIERKKLLNLVDQSFKSIRSRKINFEEFSRLIMKRTKNIETYFMTNE